MTEHEQEFEHLNYLECLFRSCKQNVYDRLIGLFTIRLKTYIEFRPRDKKEVVSIKYPFKNIFLDYM